MFRTYSVGYGTVETKVKKKKIKKIESRQHLQRRASRIIENFKQNEVYQLLTHEEQRKLSCTIQHYFEADYPTLVTIGKRKYVTKWSIEKVELWAKGEIQDRLFVQYSWYSVEDGFDTENFIDALKFSFKKIEMSNLKQQSLLKLAVEYFL